MHSSKIKVTFEGEKVIKLIKYDGIELERKEIK